MSPIEKAASAIAELRCEHRNRKDAGLAKEGFWPDRHAQPSDTEIARAVLVAIREPSEAMIEAGADEQGDCHGYESKAALAQWQAMIDVALEATPTPTA